MKRDIFSGRLGRALNVALMLVVLLVIWELGVRIFGIRSFLLPKPTAVLASLAGDPSFYLRHTLTTLYETFVGFGSAVVIGIILAIGVVYSRFLEQTVYTTLVALYSVPKVALAPLFIIWLGTGLKPIIAIVFFVGLFPIVMNSVQGLRSVEPDMLDMAKSMRASGPQILWKIRFPNSLPSIFTGLKVGISMAFIGAVVGEFVTSVSGLGYLIISAQSSFDTAQMFAAVLLLSVVGTTLFYFVEFLESAIIPWHVSQRGAAAGAH